jgi:transcription elongation factor Elf1
MMMIIYSEFPLLGKMFSCLRCRVVTVVADMNCDTVLDETSVAAVCSRCYTVILCRVQSINQFYASVYVCMQRRVAVILKFILSNSSSQIA